MVNPSLLLVKLKETFEAIQWNPAVTIQIFDPAMAGGAPLNAILGNLPRSTLLFAYKGNTGGPRENIVHNIMGVILLDPQTWGQQVKNIQDGVFENGLRIGGAEITGLERIVHISTPIVEVEYATEETRFSASVEIQLTERYLG